MGVNDTRSLHLVGDDAAHKVGRGVAKGVHEVVKRLLVEVGHGDELTALPLAFTWGGGGIEEGKGREGRREWRRERLIRESGEIGKGEME